MTTRRATKIGLLLLALALAGIGAHGESASTRVLVFTPTTEDNSYWPQVYEILEAAATDLNVELLGHDFPVEDRYAKHTDGLRILNATPDIDGAIFSVAFGQTRPLIEACARRDIPVLIQGPLFESELPGLGDEPRRRYDNWIGTFSQDEFAKGLRLGRLLIERALATGTAGTAEKIGVVGIGGDETWYGSQNRAEGLREAVRREPRATLLQIVPTQWTEAEGRRVAAGLLDRYAGVTVIWAASDQLAIGTALAARERGLAVGEDLFIGGLDLSTRGLRYVERGELTATVAAPLLGYAEVLIYLYDYIHGQDFAPETGTEISLEAQAATRETAQTYLRLYAAVQAIDFSTLSRVHNERRSEYDFSLNAYQAAINR